MTSSDFHPIKIVDDRLQIHDNMEYAVFKGAQNFTPMNYNAQTQSTSQISINVQVPSLETIIDRRVMLKSTMSIQVTVNTSGISNGNTADILGWGSNVATSTALGPFPCQASFNNMQVTLNNETKTIDMKSMLPILANLYGKRELKRFNGLCPVMPDVFQQYTDGVGSSHNVLSGFQDISMDEDLIPRGAYYGDLSFSPATLTTNTTTAVTITFTSIEPLMLPPFSWNDPSEYTSLTGINSMNIVLNVADATRIIRSTATFITSPVITQFNNTSITLLQLTGHPSDLIPSRCIVPTINFDPQVTNAQMIPTTAAGNEFSVTSNSIQLNGIPDKLIIVCRPTYSSTTFNTSDHFLPLSGNNPLSIQFNNQSGILSSATLHDLYRMSIENGSSQNWLGFSGKANVGLMGGNSVKTVSTTGSICILAFGKDINLTDDFYAPGSIGSFNLQVRATFKNTTPNTINTAGQMYYELLLIPVYSGMFICERGTSSSFMNILTKDQVLTASQQPASGTTGDVTRMIGGGFFDTLKNIASRIVSTVKTVAPVAKAVMQSSGNPEAMAAANAMGALGLGVTGAGMSGARRGRKVADPRLN